MTWIVRRQNWDADGHWLNSVYFNFNDGQLNFDNRNANDPNDNYGSVVASLGSVND